MEKEILSVRKFKAGYEIREVLYPKDSMYKGFEPMTMKEAYTPTGDYIGDPKTAYRLCVKRGIAPKKIAPDHNICSIGYCKKSRKWFGWSHRAMFGFGIGSKVKPGDCAFIPSNRTEYIDGLKKWHEGCDVKVEKKRIVVTPKDSELSFIEPIDIPYGKGAWTAKTLADAKQMAIDFANDVS